MPFAVSGRLEVDIEQVVRAKVGGCEPLGEVLVIAKHYVIGTLL